MTTLIIGGAGLIGSALTRKLQASGEHVIVADIEEDPDRISEDVPVRRTDVTDAAAVDALVSEEDPDRIVHLAYLLGAATEQNPSTAIKVNCLGTDNVFRAAGEHGVDRVAYASTFTIYGKPDGIAEPVSEDVTPPATYAQYPSLLYSATKQLNEYQSRLYADQYDLDVVAVRPSLVFGPGRLPDSAHYHWSAFFEKPARGEDAHIPHTPDQRVGLVTADDVADLFQRILQAEAVRHHAYNTGGNVVTVRELTGIVKEELNGTLTWDEDAKPIPFVADAANDRATSEFDYAVTPLREAIHQYAPTDN